MRFLKLICSLILLAVLTWVSPPMRAQTAANADSTMAESLSKPPLITPADDAWRAALPRDPQLATEAYMARLSQTAKARSNAYFEGGYWLQLWSFLYGLGIAWILLARRRSARVRDWLARKTHRVWLQNAGYAGFYILAASVLSFPLSVYAGFFREHQYGMANQTFWPWFADQAKDLGVGLILGTVAIMGLYAIFRRAPKSWWILATAASMFFFAFIAMIAPTYIDPLFNQYKAMEDSPIRTSLLSMARANGIPANDILEFNASKQTTRVSANVSGLFGSAAIRLNDNLLRRASVPEIRGVTGHEMGHYVLNHVAKAISLFAILLFAGFVFVRFAFDKLVARYGQSWGISTISDVASLPLFAAIFSVFGFVLTPINNTMVRTQEIEADNYGVNVSREPDGMAEAFLKLTEYRKPDPGYWEEVIFYDHPSTRNRIYAAMRWKAENQK
jgi:STE24 endopeptidase